MSDFDHLGISVADIDKSIAFYKQALAPLGMTCQVDAVWDGDHYAAFGSQRGVFWLSEKPGATPNHICFSAKSRAEVDAFYKAAIAAGGRDNGPPGLRPIYHENYYGAFVLDPDGNNIEAVYHGAE